MSLTPSAMTALSRICLSVEFFSSSVCLQSTVVCLSRTTLMAEKNAISFRSAAARACKLTKYQNPVPLATLAAAYAETGQFQTAVSLAEQAQELARGTQGALAARLSAMLAAYRAGHPYYQP